MHIIVRLSYMEIFLIIYLAEKVDEDNRVYTKEEDRKKFIDFMYNISTVTDEGAITYKDNSVRTAISTLIRRRLLIKDPEMRGRCWVNPEFFFRETLEKRRNMVKHIENKLNPEYV